MTLFSENSNKKLALSSLIRDEVILDLLDPNSKEEIVRRMLHILLNLKELRYSLVETQLENSEIDFKKKYSIYRAEKNFQNKQESTSLMCKVSKKIWYF